MEAQPKADSWNLGKGKVSLLPDPGSPPPPSKARVSPDPEALGANVSSVTTILADQSGVAVLSGP